jgi:hypothetical protein
MNQLLNFIAGFLFGKTATGLTPQETQFLLDKVNEAKKGLTTERFNNGKQLLTEINLSQYSDTSSEMYS